MPEPQHVPVPPSTARAPAAATSNTADGHGSSTRQTGGKLTATSGGTVSSERRHVSARVAPSNGNMFTRFMKTSNGANVCQPQPRAEGHACVQTSMDGTAVVLNPMRPERSEPRRQIGVLCNSMTKLDMVALAHQVVPAVSLGSPRFELDPPAKLGEERYDYKKHALATTKVVERADAALGLRANVSVVFYQTNPGALTSRRDFKLLTVPNHRDIKESLTQLQYAKRAPRCANHATPHFEPSSSDDEESLLSGGGVPSKKRTKPHRGGASHKQQQQSPTDTALAAGQLQPVVPRSGSTGYLKKVASDAITPNGGAALLPLTDNVGKLNAVDGNPLLIRPVAKHHAKDCICVHCAYVRDELDKFDRAMDPSASAGKRSKAGAKHLRTAALGRVKDGNNSSPGASPLRNEKLRQFLSAPAFTAPPAHNPASPTPAVVPLLQQIVVLQSALAWIRGLEPAVHARVRAAILTAFPSLKQDCDVVTSSRARRITLAEFLHLMMVPPSSSADAPPVQHEDAITPSKRVLQSDDGTPRTERFALPQRPIYGNHHVAKLINNNKAGGSGGGATPSEQHLPGTPLSPQLLASVRPWEEYFAFFDTAAAGHCDRFLLLLPILAATTHHVFLEPEAIKYDSRQYAHLETLVVVLSTMLRSRRPSDGPVRLGETFAIRDFLQCDVAAAQALAIKEGTAWVAGPTPLPLPKRRRRQLMASIDGAVVRIGDFASRAKEMAEQQELLDAAQLASLLQETLLL